MIYELELRFWSGETVKQHFAQSVEEFAAYLIDRPEIQSVRVLKHE